MFKSTPASRNAARDRAAVIGAIQTAATSAAATTRDKIQTSRVTPWIAGIALVLAGSINIK